MNRRPYLTIIALAVACVIAYAYASPEKQFSVSPAQQDVREPMKNLTYSSTLDTVTSHTADSVDYKPPVLE